MLDAIERFDAPAEGFDAGGLEIRGANQNIVTAENYLDAVKSFLLDAEFKSSTLLSAKCGHR